MAWIREQLSNGKAPDLIIDELIDTGWTEQGAEQAVWQAVGSALEPAEQDECRLCKLVPVAMSALALLVSVAVAVFVFTGQVPGAVDGDAVPGGDGAPEPAVITVEIANGTLSTPSPQTAAFPAVLQVTNADGQAHTIESGSMGLTAEIAPGAQETYEIGTAGTYTLELRGSGAPVSFTVE